MWTGLRLDAERGGSDVGSRFIPAGDWPRAEEARATFPPARLSPSPAEAHSLAGSLWISEENSKACLPLSGAGKGVYLNPTVAGPRLRGITQESWGHYVSVLTPGVRKSFCAI